VRRRKGLRRLAPPRPRVGSIPGYRHTHFTYSYVELRDSARPKKTNTQLLFIVPPLNSGRARTPLHIQLRKMNATESKASNGVSSSQRQQYALLNSPKAGVPSKSKLPFVILFIGIGIVVSLSWSDIGARMIPVCLTLPKSEHIAYDENIERQDGAHIRKHTANVSLPLIWLMSFPASATFVLRVDNGVLARSCLLLFILEFGDILYELPCQDGHGQRYCDQLRKGTP
jgi:hypothetical protein